jgi:hypothetical protein
MTTKSTRSQTQATSCDHRHDPTGADFFIACVHVMAGTPCFVYLTPDPHRAAPEGVALCRSCDALCRSCDGPRVNVSDLKYICGECLQAVMGPKYAA